MVGGESRKSRKPFAATKSSPSAKLRRTPSQRSETSSKNTNLKGLISFISRNVSNSVTSWGKYTAVVPVRTITSSENKGDVTVENTSTMKAGR